MTIKQQQMPPFDGAESAAAWEEFYARPMPKRSSIRVLSQITEKETKPKKKVKRKCKI